MRRHEVVYSDNARRDLDVIFAIVFELSGSPNTAERHLRRIIERCDRIGDVPSGGAPRDAIVEDLRIVPFEKRAVIAYVVERGSVLITNIFYAGEDYEAILRGERPDRWKL